MALLAEIRDLPCIQLVSDHTWRSVSSSDPHNSYKIGGVGVGPKVTKIIKGLENLPYNESLKELYIFSLEKAQRDLTTVCCYLKPNYREEGDSPFTRSHLEMTRGKRCKVQGEGCLLGIVKKFSTVRSSNYWNNLPEMWWSPHNWVISRYDCRGC